MLKSNVVDSLTPLLSVWFILLYPLYPARFPKKNTLSDFFFFPLSAFSYDGEHYKLHFNTLNQIGGVQLVNIHAELETCSHMP